MNHDSFMLGNGSKWSIVALLHRPAHGFAVGLEIFFFRQNGKSNNPRAVTALVEGKAQHI
jgi:hypothetical protein